MMREADTAKLESVPKEENARHEAFLTFLGQELMAFRHNALERSLRKGGQDSLDGMSTVDRKYCERINELSPEAYETCKQACEKTLSDFMQQFLALITSHAQNWPLGDRHGLNYKLSVEVIDLPKSLGSRKRITDSCGSDTDEQFDSTDTQVEDECPTYGQVLETIDLSKGASLHLPNYWFRWLNRYGRDAEPSPKSK